MKVTAAYFSPTGNTKKSVEAMAAAVAQSPAKRILIPFCNCDNFIAGVNEFNTGQLIRSAVEQLKKELES